MVTPMSDPAMGARAQDANKPPRRATRLAEHESGRADLSLVGLLCGHPVFVPPPGVARVHRLADDESRSPDRPERIRQCLAVIRGGASSVRAIIKALPFETTVTSLNDDLGELVRCRAIRVVTRKGIARYLPATTKVAE
jgi:hypothetical protein